jgi:hypothetical protein
MYVALIEVIEDWYRAETNTSKQIHIVEAESEEDAIDKLRRYYDQKDVEFCVTYSINIESINKLIS